MAEWSRGNPYEQRAVAAALCKPRLLTRPEQVDKVLRMLDVITESLARTLVEERRNDAFKTLRQGLGYCWNVAVAAYPAAGKPLLEKWLPTPDPDVAWIMRENLKKDRLRRMDPDWVARLRNR